MEEKKTGDGKVVSRFLVTHVHNPADKNVTEETGAKKKSIDPRIGRAKLLLEQIEILTAKADQADTSVKSHPLVAEIAVAKKAVDAVDAEIRKQAVEAERKRKVAANDCEQADTFQEEAERLLKLARQLRDGAKVLGCDADNITNANRAALAKSQQSGPHRKLKELRKRFNTQTHRLAKAGREARKKADRLRAKLGAMLEEIAPLLETAEGVEDLKQLKGDSAASSTNG